MWEWLGTQAQTASPFVAVFCLMMLGIAGVIVKRLWQQHLLDHDAVLTLSRSQTESNNAIASAIQQSTANMMLAIERNTGGRHR